MTYQFLFTHTKPSQETITLTLPLQIPFKLKDKYIPAENMTPSHTSCSPKFTQEITHKIIMEKDMNP